MAACIAAGRSPLERLVSALALFASLATVQLVSGCAPLQPTLSPQRPPAIATREQPSPSAQELAEQTWDIVAADDNRRLGERLDMVAELLRNHPDAPNLGEKSVNKKLTAITASFMERGILLAADCAGNIPENEEDSRRLTNIGVRWHYGMVIGTVSGEDGPALLLEQARVSGGAGGHAGYSLLHTPIDYIVYDTIQQVAHDRFRILHQGLNRHRYVGGALDDLYQEMLRLGYGGELRNGRRQGHWTERAIERDLIALTYRHEKLHRRETDDCHAKGLAVWRTGDQMELEHALMYASFLQACKTDEEHARVMCTVIEYLHAQRKDGGADYGWAGTLLRSIQAEMEKEGRKPSGKRAVDTFNLRERFLYVPEVTDVRGVVTAVVAKLQADYAEHRARHR